MSKKAIRRRTLAYLFFLPPLPLLGCCGQRDLRAAAIRASLRLKTFGGPSSPRPAISLSSSSSPRPRPAKLLAAGIAPSAGSLVDSPAHQSLGDAASDRRQGSTILGSLTLSPPLAPPAPARPPYTRRTQPSGVAWARCIRPCSSFLELQQKELQTIPTGTPGLESA